MPPANSAARTGSHGPVCENAHHHRGNETRQGNGRRTEREHQPLVGPAVRPYQAWYVRADQPWESERCDGPRREQGDLRNRCCRRVPTRNLSAEPVPCEDDIDGRKDPVAGERCAGQSGVTPNKASTIPGLPATAGLLAGASAAGLASVAPRPLTSTSGCLSISRRPIRTMRAVTTSPQTMATKAPSRPPPWRTRRTPTTIRTTIPAIRPVANKRSRPWPTSTPLGTTLIPTGRA